MQQIAVRGVQFDQVQPQALGAPRGLRERRHHALDAGLVERLRRRVLRIERQR